jgi:glycosyltransferase involved in cell wall biosynthesis
MSTDTVGEVWTYSLDLCAALNLFEVEVHLVTIGPLPTQEQRRAAEAIANVTLHSIDGKLEWMTDPWPDVDRSGEFLASLARDLNVDVVHSCCYSHGALDFGRPVIVVAHSCLLSRDEAMKRVSANTHRHHGTQLPGESGEESEAGSKYRGRVTLGLHSADAVVSPTKAFADEIARIYNPGKIRVIHSGRNGSRFGGEMARKKHPLIISSGSLHDEAKNLDLLARLAPELEWPTEIVGAQTELVRRQTELAASTLHPQTQRHIEPPPGVTLLGELTEGQRAAKLGTAGIFVSPTRYEPFGLSILEAAMSACALVVSDIPTLREIWADAAAFVHPDDAEGFRRAITALTSSPAKLKEMSGRALARSRRYRPGAMAKAYLRTYEAALRCAHNHPDDDPEPEPQNPLPVPA